MLQAYNLILAPAKCWHLFERRILEYTECRLSFICSNPFSETMSEKVV